MILSDRDIRYRVEHPAPGAAPMIFPFEEKSISTIEIPDTGLRQKIPSYGLSSAGYDLRLAMTAPLVMVKASGDGPMVIDTRNPPPELYEPLPVIECASGHYYDIPPGGYVLDSTIEAFHLPRDVCYIAIGKSTLARLNIFVNTTPAEPGWSGHLTLELHNPSQHSVRMWRGDGVTQAMFFQMSSECETSYADRRGKYQNQPNRPVQAR